MNNGNTGNSVLSFGKKNRIIFFCVNLLIMLPLIVKFFSGIGLILLIAVVAFSYTSIVEVDREGLPASAYLPDFVFFDFIIFSVLNYERLRDGFTPSGLIWLFRMFLDNPLHIQLFIIASIIAFIGIKFHQITWITGLSGGVFGLNVVLYMFSNGNLESLEFYNGGEYLLILFLIAATLWTAFLIIGMNLAPRYRINYIFMGVISLVIFILICVTNTDFAGFITEGISGGFFELSSKVLPWWKVGIICSGLLGFSFVMAYKDNENKIYSRVDPFIMSSMAMFVFAIKLLLINYFLYNIVLLLPLFILTLVCLKNKIRDADTFSFGGRRFLIVETVGFVITVLLLKYGYWMNLPVTIIFLTVLYVGHYKRAFKDNFLWITVITGLIVETLAWQWKAKFGLSNIIILIILHIFAVATFFIINYENKGVIKKFGTSCNIFVCICVLAVCLASIRTAVKVGFKADMDNKTVDISVTPKGKAGIESASYTWTNRRGDAILSEQSMNIEGETLPIESDLLTVRVTDDRGFKSTYYYWFPYPSIK